MALIHIEGWPHPVESGRLRILDAALDAGVPFPHSCGAGECGSCKCRLLEGRVDAERCSPEALSAEESAQGLILACRSRPKGDIRVQLLSSAAMPAVVKLQAKVRAVERAAHDVVVLKLALPEGQRMGFVPGQFAKLRIGELPPRSYSFANQPGNDELIFHVREVPNGRVSSHVGRALKVGAPVQVQGPFGDAHWDGSDERPLVLVGGGTGLAPMLSILHAALARGLRGDRIHLYHGVRASRDLYATRELATLASQHGFRYEAVLSEDPGADSRRGMVHEAVAADFAQLGHARVHAAGPPPMVDAVRRVALDRGAVQQAIFADAFHAAEPEKPSLWARLRGARAA